MVIYLLFTPHSISLISFSKVIREIYQTFEVFFKPILHVNEKL